MDAAKATNLWLFVEALGALFLPGAPNSQEVPMTREEEGGSAGRGDSTGSPPPSTHSSQASHSEDEDESGFLTPAGAAKTLFQIQSKGKLVTSPCNKQDLCCTTFTFFPGTGESPGTASLVLHYPVSMAHMKGSSANTQDCRAMRIIEQTDPKPLQADQSCSMHTPANAHVCTANGPHSSLT